MILLKSEKNKVYTCIEGGGGWWERGREEEEEVFWM
jgi:hypothetical protein